MPVNRDSAGPPAQADQLTELRQAIDEIDQRHADGESGFFSLQSDPDLDSGSGSDSGSDSGSGPRSRSRRLSASSADAAGDTSSGNETLSDDVPSFADALSFDTDDDDEEPDYDTSYAKAKKTAMNMLAMRDHASAELREKLIKRDYLSDAVDDLIAKLQKSKLLNDEEFAHRYVRAHRERRKLSRSVLKRELKKRGISPELISDAVDEVDGEEDLARQVAEKKAASTRQLDYEVRERRILGMLARRGFSSSICIKVTREVLAED